MSGREICLRRLNKFHDSFKLFETYLRRKRLELEYDQDYTEIFRLDDIERGDHIIWNRILNHMHHALVVDVYPEEQKLQVIHFVRNSMMCPCKVKVTMEPYDRRMRNRLYRVDYLSDCLDTEDSLCRAECSLGKGDIRLNCWKFVRMCKKF